MLNLSLVQVFTFQYGEIKSALDGGNFYPEGDLHSSMERLKAVLAITRTMYSE